MIVSDRYNFIYIAIPKCGTNTMEAILTKYFDAHMLRPIYGTNIPPKHKGKILFANIRNPFHRAVSIWWAGYNAESSDIRDFFNFAEWLAGNGNSHDVYPIFNSQSYFLKDLAIDYFIRLEKLKEGLMSMPFLPSDIVRNIEIPKLNCNLDRNGGYKDYHHYFKNRKIIEYIKEWARYDFSLGNYNLDECCIYGMLKGLLAECGDMFADID